MKAKLFLFYLRYRYICLFVLTAIAISPTLYVWWIKSRLNYAASHPWQVADVISGDRFTVARDNETKTIKLCGVSAGKESKEYLRSIIDKGNGTVEIERVKDSYEAWILLKPDFESQIHLNTWMIENGMGKIDPVTSNTCLKKENLIWAEEIAKQDKFIGVVI
jgi:endonuclease YncB( thermonuclease family)